MILYMKVTNSWSHEIHMTFWNFYALARRNPCFTIKLCYMYMYNTITNFLRV